MIYPVNDNTLITVVKYVYLLHKTSEYLSKIFKGD